MSTVRTVDMRDEAQKRAAAVQNVAQSAAALVEEKLPEKIDRAVMAVIQQRSAEDAYDKGHTAGLALGKAQGSKVHLLHGLLIAAVFATLGALGMRGSYESGAFFGTTVIGFEEKQDQLNKDLDERIAP